jgi:hypothetical protein
VLTKEQNTTEGRGEILQAAHALRKSAQTVRAEWNLTEHVAPREAGGKLRVRLGLPLAAACT